MSLPTPLPPAATLPTLPHPTLTALLNALFEPSPPLHTTLLPLLLVPHPTYASLLASIRTHLLALRARDPQTLLSILTSHPRLGARRVESAQSRAEQANLQSGGEAEARGAELAALNEEYEAKFPGLRFVVFVNGRGRGEIVEELRGRIERGDWEAERLGGVEVSSYFFLFFSFLFCLLFYFEGGLSFVLFSWCAVLLRV